MRVESGERERERERERDKKKEIQTFSFQNKSCIYMLFTFLSYAFETLDNFFKILSVDINVDI